MVSKKEMKMKELKKQIEDLKKENKILNKKRKYIKNTLFNFRQKCYSEMVTDDNSYFVISMETFNNLFENLMNKFRKVKGGKK